MSMKDRLAKLKAHVATLKQQLPPVAEKVRAAKAALPKVLDPIAKAKQALEAAAGAHQNAVASLHKDIESFTNTLPDINKVVADASKAVTSGQQSLQDALAGKAAGSHQQLLANIQNSLPTTALSDAKVKIDSIKDRLDKSKDTISKLNLDSVAAQVPALSDIVGQTLQKVSSVQNPLTQALGALSAASGAGTDPADVAAKLAKVQDHATAIGKHISDVSGLMSKSAAAVPAMKQHVDQIQQLMSSAPGTDTFANLNQLVDKAIGSSGASNEIAAAAAKFAGFTSMADEGSSILQGLAGADLLPDVKNKVAQAKGALDQVRQQLPNASSLVYDIASRTGDISGQVKKAKDALGNIAKNAGGPSADQVGKLQEHLQALHQKFGDIGKTLTAATSSLPDIEKKFGLATQLMATLRAAGSDEVTGAALKQFQDVVGEISKSDAIAGLTGGVSMRELDGHLQGAQQALNQVLGGPIPESAKGAVSQLQSLIGDATKQFPDLSKALSKGGGGFGDMAAHIENAKSLASSFSPDFVKQLGSSSQVKDLLGKATAQFPGASQALSQATKNLPQMQESVGKLQKLFGDITSGNAATGDALQQLANSPDVQKFLKHAEDVSEASSLISNAANTLPQLQQRISHASALLNSLQNGDFSSTELGDAFTDMKASVAAAAKSELGKHLSGALGPAAGLSESVPAIQDALRKIGFPQLPADPQERLANVRMISDLMTSLGDAGSQVNSITSAMTQAADSFGSLAGDLQNANGSAAGLTSAFAEQLGQSAQLKNLMDKAQQEFPEATKLVTQAAAALPQLQEKFAQGQKMLGDVMSGNVKPEDLVKQLSSSPEFQGALKAAQDQFPQAAALISKANEMLPQLQQGLDSAKDVAANLQKGDLTAALGSLQSSPQAQALLGEAAKQFPEAAAAIQQAQAVAAQAQQGFNQAKGALDDLQKGDYQAALGRVTSIPAVQNLLGDAQKQFPAAAALVSQASAALPQIKESMAQANQAMAAVQSGDYGAALAQLKTMPAVQNLLGEAQKQFPQVAALAGQAQQGLAAVQGGLAQADGLMTAFKSGDTTAALAQLQSIPGVQNALGAASQQFPEAAAMLTQASAVLPQVQQHLDQASALMDAAVAGDLNQLPAVQESAAAAETAVATAAATEAASSAASSSSSSKSSASSSSAAAAASSSTAADDVQEDAAGGEPGDDDAEGEKLLTISTPLGDDKFDVVNLRGEEKISALFSYRVEVTSKDEAIDFTQIVGQSITVYLDLGEDDPRNINGIVTRIVQAGTDDDDNTTYVLEMRPWFWKLTKAADCRIYQSKSAVDIITGLFDELGFSDYKNSTTGTYKARDYCVQYRESAFNFVSRLMEEEGIFYFFTHEDGKHTLVLADDSDSYPDCPVSEIEFDPTDNPFEDEIFKLSFEQEITTAKYSVDDFSFETSTTDLLSTADGEGMSWYEYPGGFTTTDDGTTVATKRLAAVEAGAKVLRGASTVRVLTAGCKFTLTQHVRESMNAAYVVRKVSLRCDQQKYTDTFEAIPADVVFRAPLITPKPIIHGSQTALVVGKSGEEIWVDKYGRVKVQFHWDQLGKSDENSSCWVRVAQGWAGKSWGMIFLPRIGDEVVVSFLEGNPDRPLITGSVYNAQSTVPYTLPDDQTKSTIKTMSSKQGEAGNEIRFQDLKDSEELYLHAQKDMNVLVEHDWIKHVKNSEQTYIQKDDPTADTDYKHVLVVDGKRKITIKGDANEETHTNEGKFTQTVTKEFTLTVNGDTLTITASGDLSIKGKTVTIESSSGDVTIKSAANLTAQASQSLTNKSGTELTNQAGTSLTNKSGTDLTNQAGTSLTNKASLSMTNDGGVQLTNKASATQECDGGGMLTLKGGMVKLN